MSNIADIMDPLNTPQPASEPVSGLKPGETALLDPTGAPVAAPSHLASDLLQQGYTQDTPANRAEAAARAKFGDSPGLAALAGAGRGATLGLSDQVLTKTGAVDPESLAALQKYNPIASGVGEVAGAVGSTLLAPEIGGTEAALGEGLLHGPGIFQLGEAAAPAVAGVRASPVGLVSGLGKRVAETLGGGIGAHVAGSAIEGAFYGLGKSASEEALGDPELTAQKVVANVGLGALLGGATGGVFQGLAGLGRSGVGQMAKEAALDKLQDLAEAPAETAFSIVGSHAGGYFGGKIAAGVGRAIDDAGLAAATQKIYKALANAAPGVDSRTAQYLLDQVGPATISGMKASAITEALNAVHVATNGDPDGEQRAISLGQLERHSNASIDRIDEGLNKTLTGAKIEPRAEYPQDASTAMQDIRQLANDPEALVDRVHANTAALAPMAPQVTNAVNNTAVRAVQYLASKLPPPPSSGVLDSAPPKPSSAQRFAFQQALGVVHDPLSVLAHAQQGTLTQGHVQTLQAVYPQLHQELVARALNKVAEQPPGKLSFSQKLAMSKLTGQPLVAELNPATIATIQAARAQHMAQQAATAAKPSQKGLSNLDLAARTAPGSQSKLS